MKINFEWKDNYLYIGEVTFGCVEILDNDSWVVWIDCDEIDKEFSTLKSAREYLINKATEFIEALLKGIDV